MRILASALAALILGAACGGAAAVPAAATPAATVAPTPTPKPVAVIADSSLGKILTNPAGLTLYTYTKDTPGTSTCYDACAGVWPPVVLTGDVAAPAGLAGKLGTTTRKDGTKQLTHNDRPLYLYVKDTKAGDVTGENVGTVWFVIKNP